MDLRESLLELAERADGALQHLETEEATKNALVMPFIRALGYDVFDPREVVPEYTADVGIKKGEKVDYAVMSGEKVVMLFEVKKANANLRNAHMSQLFRYFSVTEARIAILTNGTEYKFYSDLEQPNRMDEAPFLVLDIQKFRDDAVEQLDKLTKQNFELDTMLTAAADMKYLRIMREYLMQQFDEPEEEFVKSLFNRACPTKRFTSGANEQFTGLVKKALKQVLRDKLNDRINSAFEPESEDTAQLDSGSSDSVPALVAPIEPGDGIVTTDEELQGFRVVKAIIGDIVPFNRITYRDTKSYFSVLIDNNNRKPVCRLHFNSDTKKYLGLLDEDKVETRHLIDGPEGLYDFAGHLRRSAQKYAQASISGGDDHSDNPRDTVAP